MSSSKGILAFAARFVVIALMFAITAAQPDDEIVLDDTGPGGAGGELPGWGGFGGDGWETAPTGSFPGGAWPGGALPGSDGGEPPGEVSGDGWEVPGPGPELPEAMPGAGPPVPPPGGVFPANIEDPFIKELACWAVAQIDADTTSIYQQRPLKVIDADQQVVAGMRYRLWIKVGLTKCPKGQNCHEPLELLDCAAPPKMCTVSILDQPWLNGKTILSSYCS